MTNHWFSTLKWWLIDHIPMRCAACGKLKWRKAGRWVTYASARGKTTVWQCKECF